MKQADYIKQIAKFALANDNARLRDLLYQYVEYSQQNNRGKFATEILSIIKDSDRENSLGKLKEYRLNKHFDYKADEYILQTVTSSFTMKDLVCTQDVREEFEYFIKERQQTEALVQMDIASWPIRMWKDIKCLCISWRIESSTDYSQFGYSHFIETRRNKQKSHSNI